MSFVVGFPVKPLQAIVEINRRDPKVTLNVAEWRTVTRSACQALGQLATFYHLLPDIDKIKAPSKPLHEEVADILAVKGEVASSSPSVLTADEIIYCIALCQDTFSKYSRWLDK